MAVLREGGMVGHITFQAEPAEPPVGQVEVHFFAQPAFRADAVAMKNIKS
jgi:hypothetical protein